MRTLRWTAAALLAAAIGLPAAAQDDGKKPDAKKLEQEMNSAFAKQDWAAVVTTGRELVKLEPKHAIGWHHLGYALHAQGKLDEAIEAHTQAAALPKTKVYGLYNLACAWSLKKDKDKAFEQLEKAVAAGFGDAEQMDRDDDLAALRDDPRYAKIKQAVAAAPSKPMAFHNPGERRSTRVAFFGKDATQQVALSYGAPKWKAEWEKAVESGKFDGVRWRLGVDFWTTLDTNAELDLGGVKVPVGGYYVVVERRPKGEYVLVLLDPAEVRKQKIDAYQAEKSKGGIEIPLKHEATKESVERLDIDFDPGDDQTKGSFVIRFGPHKLSAAYAIKLDV